MVHLQLFTNPIQNGELLSPGNTLGTLIQLHQQKSNANSQSRFNRHNNNDTGKKYLQKTRHALKHFLNFPRKKSKTSSSQNTSKSFTPGTPHGLQNSCQGKVQDELQETIDLQNSD